MGDPTSFLEILFSSDPATRRALGWIFGVVAPIALLVFVPLGLRATRLFFLERRLRDLLEEHESKGALAQRTALREGLRDSAVQRQFEEFERRWTTAQVAEGGGRAPIRLLDVFEDRPLLPIGPRRSLIPVLPGLFLGIGVLGALVGLIPGVMGLNAPVAGDALPIDPLALQLGLALRATAWGFASAILASIVGHLIEGGFEARSRGLDELVVRAYEAVSPGELAEITRQTQQKSLDTLGRELTQFAHELNERLERGLQRIEQSSARAASLVSQEQRGALHAVVQELSLSVRQGVEHHLAELRGALQRAVDYQSSVTNGLSETFERMVENAQVQDRVARTLTDSASALDAAARTLRSEAQRAEPLLDAEGLPRAPEAADLARVRESEAAAARIAEEIGGALRGFTQQVQQIDKTMEALRRGLEEDGRARKESAAAAPSARVPAAVATTGATAGSGSTAVPTTSAEPVRAARVERATAPRERTWSPAPNERSSTPIAAPVASPQATPVSAPLASPVAAPASAPLSSTLASKPAAASAAPTDAGGGGEGRGGDLASADGPIGRELSLSGFRVGAPRAQGPDPYERLESGFEPPSNVRHFPTRDRELGDELKLSGLLGPSGPATSGPPASSRRGGVPGDGREREPGDGGEELG